MAVLAIDPELPCVMLVAERDGLDRARRFGIPSQPSTLTSASRGPLTGELGGNLDGQGGVFSSEQPQLMGLANAPCHPHFSAGRDDRLMLRVGIIGRPHEGRTQKRKARNEEEGLEELGPQAPESATADRRTRFSLEIH